MIRKLFPLIAVAALVSSTILAQDQQPPPPDQAQGPNDQQQAPPEPDGQYEQGRAVARISVLNGDVSVRRGDSGDVIAGALNAPLMAGDSIMTSSSSRTEVQLDWANSIRIAPNSEVRFSALDIKSFQVQIAAGTATFRVLHPSRAQSEIDTPSVAVHPLAEGIYRVTIHDDGTSEITVRAGEAEIFSPHGSERLTAGHTMYARGPASDPEFQIQGAIAPDNWDRWNGERDQYLLKSRSYDHMSHDIYGGEDLDQYGQWTNDPNYGSVWQPNVAPGWSPYQCGRWVWEDYYGWTWVSCDAWGWAPYHYGRWFWGAGGWAWYPGPVFGNYFWAPAYVGFFGWGGLGVGVGFGFGGLGWVPLAPFEVFHPWWGRGFYGGFHSGVLAHNAILAHANLTNVYRNARVTGAVTGVNANQFGRSGAQFQTLNHAQIQGAGLVRGAVPVSPSRSSLQFSNRAASGNFAQSHATSFASHMQAPQANRVSFQQQQRAMQQATHPNVMEASRAGVGNSAAGSRGFSGSAAGSGASGAGASHGWSRFGEPIHGSGSSSSYGRSTSPSSSGAWQRSGSSGSSAGSSGAYGSRAYGSSQGIRISPSIVQPRSPSYSPGYSTRGPSASQAPRSSSGEGSARSSSSGGSSRGASGGGASRSSGGGGGHSGGGGHGGGGHR